MPLWIVQSGLCMVCFGLWGFFSKMALESLAPKTTLALQTVGILLVTLVFFKPALSKPEVQWDSGLYALLTGITFSLGSILFFLATKEQGKVAVVVTMTALYPIVTIMLAWMLLHEPITIKQACGMGLALIAMCLMAIP